MANWIRFSASSDITTVGAHESSEITSLHNQLTNPWEDSDLVIVDGIVTINVDTENIMGVRFVRGPEGQVASDYTDTAPEENDPNLWYSYFVGKGASIFRLRSKFTIFPQYEFWVTRWKEQGPAASAQVLVAGRLLVQKKS